MSKFTAIETWSGTVAGHSHASHGSPSPALPQLQLPRALLWQNATEDQYNKTLTWLNQTISDDDLDDSEIG